MDHLVQNRYSRMQIMAFKARNRRTVWVDIFIYFSKCFACSRRSYSQTLLSTRQNVLVPAHCTGINGVRMAHHISFASKLSYLFNSTWYLVVNILGKFQKHHSKTFFFWGISLNQYFQFRIESISTYTKPAENDFHKTSFHISSTPKILTATCCFDLKGRVAWSGITPRGWIKQEIIKVKVSLPRKEKNNRGLSV